MHRLLTSYASGGTTVLSLIEFDVGSSDQFASFLRQSVADVVAPKELESSRVFVELLRCFAEATHVIVELDYFDADLRSTAAVTLSRRHDPLSLRTDRLIFAKSSGSAPPSNSPTDLLRWLKPMMEPEPANVIEAGEPDVAAEATQGRLLGYTILNADPGGLIGRSIVPPPSSLLHVKSGVPINRRVRTMVTEVIALYGRLARVSGIPFMRQDGSILTCTHVAAWMTQYSAVLRGLARRNLTADFHELPSQRMPMSRSIPSAGLTNFQVAALMEELGLPPEVIDRDSTIKDSRCAEWYDRSIIWEMTDRLVELAGCDAPAEMNSHLRYSFLRNKLDERISTVRRELEVVQPEALLFDRRYRPARNRHRKELQELIEFDNQLSRFWITEMMTTATCQHLNSGFPAIVVQPPHAWVINGYLRNRDLSEDEATNPTGTGAFIAADDQAGPYVLDRVERLAAALYESNWNSVLLPLPPGVWLRGPLAERLGAQIFRDVVEKYLAQVDGNLAAEQQQQVQHHPESADIAVVTEGLRTLAAGFNERARYSARSYVVTATDFRRGLTKRCPDPILSTQVMMARLPKFVWVVEIMDRPRREQADQPAVLGEVVLDASNVDQWEMKALITHLPGLVQVCGRGTRGPFHLLSEAGYYRSGRYHGDKDWHSDALSIVSRWKYSI